MERDTIITETIITIFIIVVMTVHRLVITTDLSVQISVVLS
jgi:hypothetical protein